jgi:putative spermidine/putrescine transport system substrate-binding protein
MQSVIRWWFWSLLVVMLAGACAMPAQPASSDSATQVSTVPVYDDWDAVLDAAEGTTVNWYMWGGSDVINTHVDRRIGDPLQAQHNLILNRIPVEDTADAVNRVLNERAAGRESDGAIDLIWINGKNFRTLKQAELLYGPFVERLPNNEFVDWEDPAVAFDFGVPVEGYESPWAAFQFVMEYNTATVGDSPPMTYEELHAWILANPGRFTYPTPPNHVGSAFVRQLFYWKAGDPAPFLGPFDQELYDEVAPQVWEYLNEIKPALWRGGQTYPELAVMADLLANREIDFAMEYDASRASNYIAQGLYPDTIRTFVFETGTVANRSYVAIPFNASNPAGAMVVANYLLSPAYQIAMTDPEELGWMVAIDPARLDTGDQDALAQMPRGVATLSPQTLSAAALPELGADWVSVMDSGWAENVLRRP